MLDLGKVDVDELVVVQKEIERSGAVSAQIGQRLWQRAQPIAEERQVVELDQMSDFARNALQLAIGRIPVDIVTAVR